MIDIASEKEMVIVLNPSPMNQLILDADLKKVTFFFIMNEIEGYQITGRIQPEEILDEMLRRYPLSKVVLTLGENGAYYQDGKERIFQEIFKVDPVDTTAAGDTFAGYFIASLCTRYRDKGCIDVCGKSIVHHGFKNGGRCIDSISG